ncbi:T9SS type B sorting domain-containing protein, partial [uncultured Flavobacterium sp.]
VYIRDKNNCGIVTDEVFLLMYPKFFTPNDDGYNDTWKINFSEFEAELVVSIFDRYGKLLKVLNQSSAWDGKFNGTNIPSDDYWFVVKRKSGKEYRNHFTLKR